MANMPPLMIKPVMPVSLMKLLAIPLSNHKTVAKWLVISPTLARKRARGRTNRYASFTLKALSKGAEHRLDIDYLVAGSTAPRPARHLHVIELLPVVE